MNFSRATGFRFLLLLLSAIFTIAITSCSENNGNNLPSEGFVQSNQVKLFYKTVGKGEPVIIIHGGPGLGYNYLYKWLLPLTDQYQLFFYDQRGAGKTTEGLKAIANMLNFMDDVEAIRKLTGSNKVHIIGHNWGALVAMRYGIKYGDHVSSMTLVCPSPGSSEILPEMRAKLTAATAPEDKAKMVELLSSNEYANKEPKVSEQLIRLNFRSSFVNKSLCDSLEINLPENYAEKSKLTDQLIPELRDYNYYPILQHLDVPVMIVYGDQDHLPESAAHDICRHIASNCKVEVIRDVGQFPFVEKPKEFKEKVISFMKKYPLPAKK